MGPVLNFYAGRMFLLRFLFLLALFVILLQMLDLLNRTDDLMAVEGSGVSSVFRYISLQAPQIVSQFTPFAALLAAVATLAGLTRTSEITVMRAAGLSVHRILFPVGAVSLLIALAHFVFNETVAVRAAGKLDYWVASGYALDPGPESETRTGVRIRFDDEFVTAASVARSGDSVLLTGVVIYGFDQEGLVARITSVGAARYADGVWHLYGVRELDALTLESGYGDRSVWETDLVPEFLFALDPEPDRTSLATLVSRAGQPDREKTASGVLMTSLLGRFSRPAATLVMPLLGAIAGFGVQRHGMLLVRATGGAALGFLYFVVENLALALGKLGVLPAFLGAFFPLALFMVVGYAILLAMEN